MAEVENFDQSLLLKDLVVNENRAVDQLTHLRPFADGVSHVREAPEQIDVVQQGLAKTGGSLAVVLGDMAHDPGQVV
jgi:hypothetical protein